MIFSNKKFDTVKQPFFARFFFSHLFATATLGIQNVNKIVVDGSSEFV